MAAALTVQGFHQSRVAPESFCSTRFSIIEYGVDITQENDAISSVDEYWDVGHISRQEILDWVTLSMVRFSMSQGSLAPSHICLYEDSDPVTDWNVTPEDSMSISPEVRLMLKCQEYRVLPVQAAH